MATINQVKARKARVEKQLTQLKSEVAEDIADHLETHGITQTEGARLACDAPSQLSLVVTGKLRGFSLERLIRIRAMLTEEIDVRVGGSSKRVG